ncbi:HhH-GPD-type base excision DNA repair protein [soil metagenome]
MPKVTLSMSEPADELLSRDPLALLLGMLLDQQVTMEKAFVGPYILSVRLGHELDARELAEMDPERLRQLFADRPALHRFPGAMAQRVQQACHHLVERYDGDAARLWADVASGDELRLRIEALPGFGAQKAAIFLALLGKQYEVRPAGWREAAGPYGEEGVHRSVADVTDAESLALVRDYKRAAKQAAQA